MAKEVGIKRTTYTNYELDTSPTPSDIIEKLLAKGITPPATFRDTHRPPPVVQEVSRPYFPVPNLLVPIPKGPAVPASEWSDPLDAGYDDFIEVDPEFAGHGVFACEILGDSMLETLRPGDLAIYKASPNPKIGTIIIARNEQLQATCKQLLHNGREFVLHATNPAYEDVTSAEWTAIGFLIGIIRREGSRTTKVFDPDGIRP